MVVAPPRHQLQLQMSRTRTTEVALLATGVHFVNAACNHNDDPTSVVRHLPTVIFSSLKLKLKCLLLSD